MDRGAKWLRKKARSGFRGYPAGTVAFYGPDDRTATKVAAGIVERPAEGASVLRRWFSEDGKDIRGNEAVLAEVVAFFREHGVHTVAMTDGIFGCPHEEGTDYPEGETCPQCPFWADRDRTTKLV